MWIAGRREARGAVGNVIDLKNGFILTTIGVGDDSVLAGRRMRELPGLDGWNYLVAFAEQESGGLIPKGDTVVNPGDTLGVVSRTSDLARIAQFAQTTRETFRRIVVFGADRVGSMLMPLLAGKGRREVVAVDRDAARCHEIAERNPDVRVLCGDITDEALMNEENLYSCDLIVAASGNYELNLVTAAYMKSKGASKAVALTASTAYGAVAEAARTPLAERGMSLLVQGEDLSRESMTARLRAGARDDGAGVVLFGVQSFWEGVDVSGDALSCVVIARLPFAQIGDPMVEARSEKIDREGGSSFREYMLPEAVIKFRQGFGRLIRSRRDRGVVVVADPRLVTKNYGAVFRKSIPAPVRTIADADELVLQVKSFFEE